MASISSQIYLTLLESGNYSDLIIDCQGTEFKVHRVLVCPQSPMIDAAVSGQFEEALTGKVKFPEENPAIMARILLYIYTNDYNDKSLPGFYAHLDLCREARNGAEDSKNAKDTLEIDQLGLRKRLNVNALVYKGAEMLGLSGLQTMASDRFMRDAQVAFAMDGFEEPAELLYQNTREDDNDLRLKVTQLCIENHDQLGGRPKTVAVFQHHETKVWNVTIELMKRWAANITPHSKSFVVLRHWMESAVEDCNIRKAGLWDCGHITYSNTARLKLEGDRKLTMPCPHC